MTLTPIFPSQLKLVVRYTWNSRPTRTDRVKIWALLVLAASVHASSFALTITFDNYVDGADNDYANNFIVWDPGGYLPGVDDQMITSGGITGGAVYPGPGLDFAFLKTPIANLTGYTHQVSIFFKRGENGRTVDLLGGIRISPTTNSFGGGTIQLRVDSSSRTAANPPGALWVSAEVTENAGSSIPYNLVEDLSNTGFDDWFRLTTSLSILNTNGTVLITGSLEHWGTNGTGLVSSWGVFSQQVTSTNFVNTSALYVGFFGMSDGTTLLDNFSVVTFATTNLFPALTIRVSEVELCWNVRLDKTYQIQFTTGLPTGTWTNLGSPVHPNGSTLCALEKVLPGNPQRYYRVVELP